MQTMNIVKKKKVDIGHTFIANIFETITINKLIYINSCKIV